MKKKKKSVIPSVTLSPKFSSKRNYKRDIDIPDKADSKNSVAPRKIQKISSRG